LILGAAAKDEVPRTFGKSKPIDWSQRLAKSEMNRKGKTLFEYYISEPVIENDLKGVGPFILGYGSAAHDLKQG